MEITETTYYHFPFCIKDLKTFYEYKLMQGIKKEDAFVSAFRELPHLIEWFEFQINSNPMNNEVIELTLKRAIG